ncbi:MAG: RagB/SusD family nutrient uptake outer membrane protein [Muribaculaceae bacterium]|nr:RagB/SusD family nutrient uptake outer membrane protein [Muribaculaceae bacterium]
MKNIKYIISALGCSALLLTSCMKEFQPQGSVVTGQQATGTSSAFQDFINALTTPLSGLGSYRGDPTSYPYDFGISSFFLTRDLFGQDIIPVNEGWFSTWYEAAYQGPNYAYSQMPLSCYYSWIKSCNDVIGMAGEDPDVSLYDGLGQAYAMRALFYMDIAQMYAPQTYRANPDAPSCTYISEKTTAEESTHNPRKTNREIFELIIEDLDNAEQYIAGYKRSDITTPDISVVYGLKARAYLIMGDWANAEKYAKQAQQGYSMMTAAQYTSKDDGFNTPNGAWMFATRFNSQDPCILLNDADSSWGSWMIYEITDVSGCGYACNYGYPMNIDRHLYETIPSTDIRRNVFVDFALNDLSKDDCIEALKAYSDYPETVYYTGVESGYSGGVGGIPLKFRAAGGVAGHNNQYIGFCVWIPLMRVEEMMLIEAEAAGMQNEGRGIQLLTAFAQQRDPSYVYGTHNEAYGNSSTPAFQNECWWQRRVELWGEGFATFDIKRLEKGIIRNYENTNHVDMYRWNTTTTPQWMTIVYCQTESNYNFDLVNNPTPIAPDGNTEPPYVW